VQEHLQKTLLDSGSEVVFHVLGFSANHNAPFLESLSFLGTSDGSYSYVSPGVRLFGALVSCFLSIRIKKLVCRIFMEMSFCV
jgi:hypothetical protein